MKKRSVRISKIVAIAQSEERRVCLEMGRAQQSLDAEIDRLQELESYRQSYTADFSVGDEVSATRWQDYQNFLQRIDDAVQQQKEVVLTGRQKRDAHRRHWMKKRQRVDSLERVVDRYKVDEHRADERLQQKTQDDLTAAGHRTRKRR